MSTDERNSDQDLKAYLDGRDGVSAAYRETAQEQPPAALDRRILDAARRQARPVTAKTYAARRPYALAASVMIAIAGLSLYLGRLDDFVASTQSVQPGPAEAVEFPRLERAAAVAPSADEEEQRADSGQQQRAAFANRQLAPPVPAVGAAEPPAAPAAAAETAGTDALALSLEAAPVVIDGPLLESIEADAAAAQARPQGIAVNDLEEVTVTGSRIVRREETDVSYRASREDWLAEIRAMADELAARSRLVTARRNASVLEERLEEEIELFLEVYPETDIDAELEK